MTEIRDILASVPVDTSIIGFVSDEECTADEDDTAESDLTADIPLTVGSIKDADEYFIGLREDAQAANAAFYVPDEYRELKVKELDEIDDLAKFVIQVAIQKNASDCADHTYRVNLPSVVSSREILEKRSAKKRGTNQRSYAAIYKSMERAAERLENHGVAYIVKADHGIKWICIKRAVLMGLVKATVDRKAAERETLILLDKEFMQNSNSCEFGKNDDGKSRDKQPFGVRRKHERLSKDASEYRKNIHKIIRRPRTFKEAKEHASLYSRTCIAACTRPYIQFVYAPKNVRNERLEAIRICRGIKKEMTKSDRREVAAQFNRYNDRVTDKIILLLDKQSGDLLGAEYSTRFNDSRKAAIALNRYDLVVKKSLEKYWDAAFLTLTTDPERFFGDISHANRHLAEAWNKFMSYLTKRHGGKRPEYITSYEYTKKGLIHLHVIFFLDWVDDIYDINEEWSRCGQGEVGYIYGLTRVIVNGTPIWRWKKGSPNGTNERNGADYLKKYLKKVALAKDDRYATQGQIQSLFWVFNKRFWSCSRKLLPTEEELETEWEKKKRISKELEKGTDNKEQKIEREAAHMFYGLISEEQAYDMDVKMIYHRGGSGSLYDPPDDSGGAS